MGELRRLKLGDIAEISTGYPFDGNKYGKTGIRVLRGENIGHGFLHWEERVDKRWNDSENDLEKYFLKDGDIVMQMDGNIGRNIAILSTEEPVLIAQRVACIRAKSGFSQAYIYGLLRTKVFFDYITRCTTGTSIQHISLKQISDFTFNVPSAEEQTRIGNLLSTLDRKIELNKRINDNLYSPVRSSVMVEARRAA
jgi:type I restriction enzyme, S subunit